MTGTNRKEADPRAGRQRPRAVESRKRTRSGAVSGGTATHYDRWVCLDSTDLANLMALLPLVHGNWRSGFGTEASLDRGGSTAAPAWSWGV